MYTGKTGESRKGEWGESEGAPANILNKDRSGILDSITTSYWSIMRPSVNTRALVTLMRNALWRGRRGPFIFNGGEGTGGIRRIALVGYDDPLFTKKFLDGPPLCPKLFF